MTLIWFISSVVIFMFMSVVAIINVKLVKLFIPILFVCFIAVTYFQFNSILGTVRPVYNSFLGKVDFTDKTLTVLGGNITDYEIVLLVQDDQNSQYRTYSFPSNKNLLEVLSVLMEKHANKNGGEHWGFKIVFNSMKKSGNKNESTEFYGFSSPAEYVSPAQVRNEMSKDLVNDHITVSPVH